MTGLVSRFALVAVLALSACDDKPPAKPAPANTVQKAPVPTIAAPPASAASSPMAQAINAAAFDVSHSPALARAPRRSRTSPAIGSVLGSPRWTTQHDDIVHTDDGGGRGGADAS